MAITNFKWNKALMLEHLNNTCMLEQTDLTENSALMSAAILGETSTLNHVIKSGVNLNQQNKYGATALYRSVIDENFHIVQALIKAGADPNIATHTGETPLSIAAEVGFYNEMDILLEYGADVELINKWGRTPLYKAVEYEMTESALKLLRHGADLNSFFWDFKNLESSLWEMTELIAYIEDHHQELTEENMRKWKAFRLKMLFV